MAYSIKTYAGNGSTTDFAITFDYLDTSHVKVSVDNILTTSEGSLYAMSFNTSTNLRVVTVAGSAPVPTGASIKVFRETPIDEPAVIFGGGASLSSVNLNKNSEYLTFALQEATDANEEFTKLYLGAYSEQPTTDNSGDPLQVGAVFYDTDESALYYWTGSVWLIGESVLLATAARVAAEAAAAAALVSKNTATVKSAASVAAAAEALASSVSAAEYVVEAARIANSAATLLRNATLVSTGQTAFTLDHDLPLGLVFIDGVQQSIDAYSYTYPTLTFTGTVASGSIVDCLFSAGSAAYSLQTFETVANVLADTTFTYENIGVGASFVTRKEGFAYEVVASGATDQHVTTAGGLKLYVLPGELGFNVKAFGAEGDGVTNDTAALQKAANTSLPIFVPTGVFILSAAITFTGVATVRGEGIGRSKLQWSNTNGFEITGVLANNNPVDLSDFSMLTSGDAVGKAVVINNSAQSASGVIQNRTSVRLMVRNVAVLGTGAVNLTGWESGLFCTDVLHATIDGFHFTGNHSNGSNSVLDSLNAIYFTGTGSPVELVIKNSWAFHVREAVHVENCEGVFISQCNFVNVNYGVLFTAAGKEPQLNLTDNHINANIMCVSATELAQGIISNNLLYARNTALGNVLGLRLANCIFTQVANNTFVNTSAFNFDAIVFTTDGSGSLVKDNVFQSATTAIWLQAGSTGVRVGENVYAGVTTDLLDLSPLSYVRGAFTQVKRSTTYSLANGAGYTAIPWTESEQSSAASWAIANPTRLTARATGRYRISGTIVFSLDAVGARRATIRKNGDATVGYPNASATPIAGANTVMSLGEVTVSLNDGDYVEFLVAQTSGAAMTLPVAESAFKLEFVSEA